jgi:hypothetical protein
MVAIIASLSFLGATHALSASAEPDTTNAANGPAVSGALTDRASSQKPAVVVEAKPVEKAVSKPKAPVAAVACIQAKPPVYVADWARLAELTQSDSLIFAQVDAHARRHETARQLVYVGAVVGVAAAVFGTFRGLSNQGWNNADRWTVGAGLGLAAVSLLTAWAVNPDQDDFLTLMNHWNLRHPDLVMAP